MATLDGPVDVNAEEADSSLLADESVDLVLRWLTAAQAAETGEDRRSARRLHRLVDDPGGVAFTMQFVDRVIRPDDVRVAAGQLHELAGGRAPLPRFLSPVDRVLLRAGATLAPRLPHVVMPLARRRMRQIVGHLVVDAHGAAMDRHLGQRRAQGFDLNVNLLGEAVLGEREAARRLEKTIALLDDPHVDYVSVKISGIASQLQHWAWEDSLDRIADRLRTILRAAAGRGTFVNLDMEEYHDLELTMAAFRRVLDEDEFLRTEAGIVLQAYLPDAFDALQRLTRWANERHDRGGAEIKIRLVKGANLAMERVDAAMHGWEQAPYPTKADTDASYKRCLDWVLRPDHVRAVRIGVGSHNLFDVAWATLLADRRGVSDRIGVEMLEGMAPAQARVMRDELRSLLLYTPVVDPDDFDVAIAYLFRRLEENAAVGNFLRALGDLEPGSAAFVDQAAAFRRAVEHRWQVSTAPRRAVDRSQPPERFGLAPFANEPESDPAVAGTRQWALDCLSRRPEPVRTPMTTDTEVVDEAIARAEVAQRAWWARSAEERRTVLRAVGDELARRRGDLLTAMAHEGRKTVAQADPEICEAVDFCRYYADRADLADPTGLPREHARFEPLGVVAVVPPWNFPVAIPTGGMVAALAAGNAVLAKPAPEVPRCTELVVEAAHAAGVPEDLLQLLRVPEDEVGRHLLTSVDAVVLTGGTDTAQLFRSWKPDLVLFAETSGKNAIVITPNADLDLAVADLVSSAFGHAGQKCSAASLAICVGDVYDSPRFRRQLVDAVESLAVGPAHDPTTTVGPLIGRPNPRLAKAFAELQSGEEWLVEPRPLDDAGELWSPGVRLGVQPGSWFHRTECFGPVLGLMHADDLDDAIRMQNASEFGLTGGLHSLDPAEIERWVDQVEVGNAYVNRGITGAIVQRQPFGGWKRSSVGSGAKAGGPGYVVQLGTWHPTGPLEPAVWEASDARWWAEVYGTEHDPTALFCESNVQRYRPLPRVALRIGPDATDAEVARVRHAAATCGVPLVESRSDQEPDEAFAIRLPQLGVERVRVVGGAGDVVKRVAAEHWIHVDADPVTADGGVELHRYLREQSVTRTLHRFGNLVQADASS
ncbi:MAG TPA: bifunctional proline dehydrogenase/L-glutamate gamma-semialdehyde dehydrogenase [Acidimicrobiales bacterium]|nr:bifunctional proline dehydrogenase/L-glutamate gamma-semialdehyde dehydrogenase [Acidimicrobiales bacterium]